MPFVNELLTPEQRTEVSTWGLKRPIFGFGCIIRETDYHPIRWTADHARKLYLLGTSVDRDFLDERVFIFIRQQKQHLVQFRLCFADENTALWCLPDKYLIAGVFTYCTEDGFLDDLREALTAYGWFGFPDHSHPAKCAF